MPWAFFDRVSQGNPPLVGPMAIFHHSSDKKLLIKFAPRHGSNNKAELVVLWAVLKVENNKGINNIQCFGESKVVVDWALQHTQIMAPHLQAILRSILSPFPKFQQLSFKHVYRELNTEVDALSKQALTLPLGTLTIMDVSSATGEVIQV